MAIPSKGFVGRRVGSEEKAAVLPPVDAETDRACLQLRIEELMAQLEAAQRNAQEMEEWIDGLEEEKERVSAESRALKSQLGHAADGHDEPPQLDKHNETPNRMELPVIL